MLYAEPALVCVRVYDSYFQGRILTAAVVLTLAVWVFCLCPLHSTSRYLQCSMRVYMVSPWCACGVSALAVRFDSVFRRSDFCLCVFLIPSCLSIPVSLLRPQCSSALIRCGEYAGLLHRHSTDMWSMPTHVLCVDPM